jgi:PST family polysaccharide transporter
VSIDIRAKEKPASAGLGKSYGQVVKATSILGGAQAINYLIGMVRTKAVAVLLGPAGVGLVGLWQSLIELLAVLGGAGMNASGVREIAKSNGSADRKGAAGWVSVVRKTGWIGGAVACILTVACAVPLTLWTFGSSDSAAGTAWLGLAVLFATAANAQIAVMQGMQRLGEIAKASIFSMAASACTAVVLYSIFGERAIVPVLILSAAMNFIVVSWYARQADPEPSDVRWRDVPGRVRPLLRVGFAFLWGSLLAFGVALGTRMLVVREAGIEGNGIYQASWAISGMFASFILSSLASDFFPRVSAVADDHKAVGGLVNEQIEVGLLLGLPGLVGTLAFSPFLFELLYSAKFSSGVELLPWFMAGVLGRLVAWPMVLVMPAIGASRSYAIMETCWNAFELALAAVLIRAIGLPGVAVAFAARFAVGVLVLSFMIHRYVRFQWSPGVLRLVAVATAALGAGALVAERARSLSGFACAVAISTATCIFSMRGLARRLGAEHRLVRMLCNLPMGRVVCGL